MPYSDPNRAEEYWSYCAANDAKCQRLPECLKASRCLSGGPYPVSYPRQFGRTKEYTNPNPLCQAYDYCPKREACLIAARCLDARAGPPRPRGAGLAHEPLVEVPEDREPTPPHDPVNHPSHYTSHPSRVECIQVTRWMNFNLGNAVKYIWRAGEKSRATEIEDLKKARWHLDDEIKRLEVPDGKTEG